MSGRYMPTCSEELKISKMMENIASLQQALQQISDAKKQLCRNTTEAKSRIQCNISRQLETLRNREVWLLNQLDVVSNAKEEVLQQQSARLNQTLGVLQSSVQFPNNGGDTIARLDLGDVHPEETPYLSFKSDPRSLRDAIMNYGLIDPNCVPPPQSPFMAPDQPAPSLPKQFEDYNDAEHHILYKTVEEINRTKMNEPLVQVNIPKLSNRLDDWLLYPSTSSSVTSNPRFTLPQLSNNLSDWLRAPISVTTTSKTAPVMRTTVQQDTVAPLEGISTDASIKTWLHKIKQNPYEEDDEDYDFVEEISDTRSHYSTEILEQYTNDRWLHRSDTPNTEDRWLHRSDTPNMEDGQQAHLQIKSLPMDNWLLKPERTGCRTEKPVMIDMSRYLRKVTDELDQWLISRVSGMSTDDTHIADENGINERLRPVVPSSSSLSLSWAKGGHLSRADNPWLHKSRTRASSSFSPVSRRSSSASSISSKLYSYNKWLLKGGNSGDSTLAMNMPCSLIEKYKSDIANVSWLKSDSKMSAPKNDNPLSCFESENFDFSLWLKPQGGTNEYFSDGPSPLEKVLDFQRSSSDSLWLLDSNKTESTTPSCFDKMFEMGGNQWLPPQSSPFEDDLIDEL